MKPWLSADHPRKNGFSLIEALTVIAILGIICGIVIPKMFMDDVFKAMRDKRNAQEIASMCSAAQAAGLDFVVPGDVNATVSNVIHGGIVTSGVFRGRKFILSGMAPDDAIAAGRYLRVEGNQLRYGPIITSLAPVNNGTSKSSPLSPLTIINSALA